jgi:hypothetical protein
MYLVHANHHFPHCIVQNSLAYYGLCQTFEKIEATTKRLEILKYLTEYYVQVIKDSPMELVECVYLCLNRVCLSMFFFPLENKH